MISQASSNTVVVGANTPRFCIDLINEAFGKHPKDIALNVIHPGGAKMIPIICQALQLAETRSESLAFEGMLNGGNKVSCTLFDMLRIAWDELKIGDEVSLICMGPGVTMEGVAAKVTQN